MKLRTKDVAICADTSPYVVREYIDAGLVGPIYRSKNNYRWVDPRAIPQAHLWRTLQQLGFTMEQLRAFGQNRSPENALELFHDCDGRLEREIAGLQARQDMLRSYVSLIEEGRTAQPGEIEIRTLEKMPIHHAPLDLAEGEAYAYRRLCNCIMQIPNSGSPLGYAYGDFFNLLEHPGRPAQLVSFDPKGTELRPAGQYLVGTAVCEDGVPTSLARRMLTFALQNGLEFRGPAYTIYLLDAVSVVRQEQCLLQITAGVEQVAQGY